MKTTRFSISILILALSCSSNIDKKRNHENESTITFIADFENPKAELIIKNMIRNSILEEEYLILHQDDTITLNSIGRSFYMAGLRGTIFDSLVINQGDTIRASIIDNDIHFTSSNSNLADNLSWLVNYQYEIEDAYQCVFEQITDTSANLDFLKVPFVTYNDYQISQSLYSHIYQINREAYIKNKSEIDNLLNNKYAQFNTLISRSELDQGSKEIMQYLLFNSTTDKFNRMGSTVQKWMHKILNDEINKDCSFQMNTQMSDFYLNFWTKKHYREITYVDLQKAYLLLDQINCLEHQQETKRVCLLKMFIDGNKVNQTKKLLNQYCQQYEDNFFYDFIQEKFPISDPMLNNRSMNGSYVDIYDKDKTYKEIISQEIGNVILIDFWASWCGPCRKSMPNVKKLEQKYKDQKFKVIYISIDKYPNHWEKSSKEENIWRNNNYWAYNFQDSEVYKNFNITHIPRYILYSKDGKVAYHKGLKPSSMEEIIQQLLIE